MKPWRAGASAICMSLAAMIYGLGYWSQPAFDADLGFHLMGGAWMRAHGEVPSADFINSFNPYWHDYHWLAQIILYQLYVLGGSMLLRVGLGLVLAYLCKVLLDIIWLSRRQPLPPIVAIICFLWSISLIGTFVAVRPQILSLLLVAIATRRLIQRPTAWELPFLFVLAVLAANVHVYWVLIPLLWGAYRVAPRLVRQRSPGVAYAWGGFALLIAAALVSPYGLVPLGTPPPFAFMNYALLWEYLAMAPALRNAIGEMKGIWANEWFNPWLIVLALVVVARAFSSRRGLADFGNSVAAAGAAVLAFRSAKFVPVLAVVGLPYLVKHASLRVWRQLPGVERYELLLGRVTLALLALYALVATARHFPPIDNNDAVLAMYQPIAACRHIATLGLVPRAPRTHVRVMTHFNHGSWCRWSLFEQTPDADFRVTTDGRTQDVPVTHFLASFDVYNATGAWRNVLAGWNPDVLVVSKGHQLAAMLALDPEHYRLVFEDDRFVVFVPLG